MRCLVAGGTGFLGGAIANTLVDAGHDVAVLTRGTSINRIPKGAKLVSADRHNDLSAVVPDAFDWVFDSCAYAPDHVEKLLDAVGPNIKRYVFISSISVYENFNQKGITEAEKAPAATDEQIEMARNLDDAQKGSAGSYMSAYGPLKRSCEIKAEEMLGDRATSLRVGSLIGKGDYTDRFTWWVRRIEEAKGERQQIVAPAPSNRAVQTIDVYDVADFALQCADKKIGGSFNVTGREITLNELINQIAKATGTKPEVKWRKEDDFSSVGAAMWTSVPLALPLESNFKHMLEVSIDKAVAKGLRLRPLSETLEPLLAWDRSRREIALKCGLTPSQEKQLLEITD